MTPETLVRHELAGLRVTVVGAADAELIGVAGRVVDETTNTLLVATGEGVKQVPKAVATFRFELDCEVYDTSSTRAAKPRDDHEANGASDDRTAEPKGGGETVRVVVDGERLVARPARRTEQHGGSLWQ